MKTAYTVLLAMLPAVLSLAGCSQATQDAAAPAPPQPPQPQQKTFDYTHSVHRSSKRFLTRKFVVALVRFEEDKRLEDEAIPFGPPPDTLPAAPHSTNIAVNIDSPQGQPRASGRQPLGTNMRAREALKRELLESDSFTVVERERILDLLREQKFGQSQYVNSESSPRTGELMGVQYLIEAHVGLNEDLTFKDTADGPRTYKDGDAPLFDRIVNPSKADQQRRLRTLRERWFEQARTKEKQAANPCGVYIGMYSVETGEVAAEAYGIGPNGLLAIQDAVEDLVDKCSEIPNPPRIVAIDGDRLFLDMGEKDKVVIGQKLRYLAPGRTIRNPAGQAIGRSDEEGGELEITKVEELMSIAKTIRVVTQPQVGAILEPLE